VPTESSGYRAPLLLRNAHLQTVLGAFRPAPAASYRRERIDTPDGDFLDLDWAQPERPPAGSPLLVISFGMEGDPQRPYVRGLARAFGDAGWNVLVWNYRGTSGEPNRKTHFYHGGLIEDLEAVLQHALRRGVRRLALAGFSLGGNLTLNYLGRRGVDVPPELAGAVCFSAPCDVEECAVQMNKRGNRLYMNRFLSSFRGKIRAKMQVMPEAIHDRGYETIRTLEDYDARYTVPHFGFDSVPAFYRHVSSRHVAAAVRIPTLVVNALDDPLMGPSCHPREAAATNPHLHLETPAHGGHLGFLRGPGHARNWMEERALAFLEPRRKPEGQ
jgi:predicted alpha/beta-fold hydrolase